MIKSFLPLIILSAFLAACSAPTYRNSSGSSPISSAPGAGGVHKVGKPYKIAGQWYYPKVQPNYDEVGIASWYGKKFHGKKTANGETYNMNSLTAAHKTLPMPSNVKVTNLDNGRSIIVRVNDRGPFVGDRIIDLSRRSAQILGFQNQGTTKVRVQVVDNKGRPVSNKKYTSLPQKSRTSHAMTSNYVVLVGSFSSRDNAEQRAHDLKKAGLSAKIVPTNINEGRFFRVIVDYFSSRGRAEKTLAKVRSRGFYDSKIISE